VGCFQKHSKKYPPAAAAGTDLIAAVHRLTTHYQSTRRPLAGVVLDLWHVDMQERYSDGVTDFRNRGRLVTSEGGYYEVESIRPIPYRPSPKGSPYFWRCAHFHLLAVCPGYKPVVTEIHFKEGPKMSDSMYRPQNTIAPEKRTVNGRSFETAVFDIVLEREAVNR
jgi:protocatechuate 3,4-dioxygenase beta subunit